MTVEKIQQWRFWPLICLAFLYLINVALINLATPLYFFKQGTEIVIIGFLVIGSTITYCFSPILLYRISKKIGRKLSILLGVTGISFSQVIFYFTLEPIPFLIARMIEGFMAGFIWPSITSSISDKKLDHDKHLARFNFSWNAGLLTGFLLGAIILYFVQDLVIIFYFAPFLMFINIIIILLFFKESKRVNNDHFELAQQTEISKSDKKESEKKIKIKSYQKNDMDIAKFYIPVVIPVLILISYCMSKVGSGFLYALKSETLGFETYTVYLLSFFSLLAQLISITIASYFSLNYLKRVPLISIFSIAIILVMFGIVTNFFGFIILFILLGFFTGLLFGSGLKLILFLNLKNETSKYSTIQESTIGFSFLFSPILAAFIASYNLNLSFFIFSTILLLILVILLLLLMYRSK